MDKDDFKKKIFYCKIINIINLKRTNNSYVEKKNEKLIQNNIKQ